MIEMEVFSNGSSNETANLWSLTSIQLLEPAEWAL